MLLTNDYPTTFLDVRGAFDNVNYEILLEKLANIDCSAIVLNFKCRNVVEKAVNTIKNNLNSIGLDLAHEKTVLIHFNNERIEPGQTNITIDKCVIKSSETVRYLGLILDYKFSFIPHINQKKIEKLHYTALRVALGYRISTPTNIIIAESKLPLIKDRAELLGKCFTTKLINQCIEQILDKTDFYEKTYIFSYDYKTITTNITVNTDLGKKLKLTNDPNNLLNEFLSKENACAIYTDGSKPQDAKFTGTACVCPDLNLTIVLSYLEESEFETAYKTTAHDLADKRITYRHKYVADTCELLRVTSEECNEKVTDPGLEPRSSGSALEDNVDRKRKEERGKLRRPCDARVCECELVMGSRAARHVYAPNLGSAGDSVHP
ncbi:hypothetical protein TSAR_002667 [Trichomalopsis sarcophagae]|uniref:Reverse transcriptase domain-containing protein n=1 Tax=Trichomalopsis sarcophagae TaxID=543379 RepID=A0A232EH07_9HYME|nr:hypothetical protein TSAR_002667 [Trichomalopsis sarcophagae]